MAEFRMPSLGADMESGTLIAWHMKVGDHVAKGDIVAEVDTDKSVIDVETFATGTVEELLVPEGARVPVGAPLAIIRDDVDAAGAPQEHAPVAGEMQPAPRPPAADESEPLEPAPGGTVPLGTLAPTDLPGQPSTLAGAPRRPASSPLARRHASTLGIDLAAVPGTGPGGAVTTSDVDHFAAFLRRGAGAGEGVVTASHGAAPEVTASHAAAPEAVHLVEPAPGPAPGVATAGASPAPRALAGRERQAALRRAIGASMARSKREIPHYYLATDIDMLAAVRWLEARNAVLPVTERILPAVLLLKATALALRETPDLNGFWEDGGFRPGDGIHLGTAIALRGGGLVAPALHDADRMTLAELMAGLRDLVARARTGGLRSSEMSDPTITVTSLGDQGVDVVHPVIYPPQVAIVGFGRTRERPWAVDGLLGVRPVVTATLAADHRVSDGHRGALFLTALDRLLTNPEEL